jgi:hypothetical protein
MYEHWTAKELAVYSLGLTRALDDKIDAKIGMLDGKLDALDDKIGALGAKLQADYTDNRTREFITLKSRDKWFKGIITTVVTAVAVAETLKWLGLDKFLGEALAK